MNINHLRVGIIHSLIGKNDGVSIVIDQTVNAMVKDMGIELGSIFFLAAHSSPRFNAETDDVFWHKSETHKTIIDYFSEDPPTGLDGEIMEKSQYAHDVIKKWVKKNKIDLIIAHNTSHPYNFVTACGLGMFIEELRDEGIIWPKLMVWWHDSYFERPIFAHPNEVIKKYLKYLPGTNVDGIAYINHMQSEIGLKYLQAHKAEKAEKFTKERTVVVPNTTDIPWDWELKEWESNIMVAPPQDNYNDSFLQDVGLLEEISERGISFEDTKILLQHTRIVPRKCIERAIDLAFLLEKKYREKGQKKCVVLLVSGHSGDEQVQYKSFLASYYDDLCKKHPDQNVVLLFGEDCILSHRDIIVDKKYYNFAEVPGIIAGHGGIGTYFSEIEGFGNNLLEMMSAALPVVINEYEVYKDEIKHLGFDLPSIDNCVMTDELVNRAFDLLTDIHYRNKVVRTNLTVLRDKLDHKIISDKLKPLIRNMFTRTL